MRRGAVSLFYKLLDCSENERTQYFAEQYVDPETRQEAESLLAFDHISGRSIEDIVQHAIIRCFNNTIN